MIELGLNFSSFFFSEFIAVQIHSKGEENFTLFRSKFVEIKPYSTNNSKTIARFNKWKTEILTIE